MSAPSHRAIDDQTARGVKPARTRQDQLRRDRLQVLIVCLVMLTAIGLGVAIAMTTGLPSAFRSMGLSERESQRSGSQARNSSEGEGSKFGTQMRSGTIVPLTDPCKQLLFDNDNGNVAETGRPCRPEVVLDASGVPVPQGTINRMNAIRGAFSKDR